MTERTQRHEEFDRERVEPGAGAPARNLQSRAPWSSGVPGIGPAAFLATFLTASAFLFVLPTRGFAQDDSTDQSLVEQLRELRNKVLKLEAALNRERRGGPPKMSGMSGMSKGKQPPAKKKMGMKKAKMAGMGTTPAGSAMGVRGKRMMGRTRGDSMAMPSALPGFPGASHIYHVGSTGFFLDHDQHIQLSREQRAGLSRLREQTLLAQATFDRRIEEAEQELWKLTASDKPDIAKITAQVRDVARMQGDQRIAFIRAVGEAARLLTAEQRGTLIGTLSAGHAPSNKTEARQQK